jgi:adenylate kinase family enzyme
MRRIMVVGCPGAGKSWLAERVAAKTGSALIRLDQEHWQPGWVAPPADIWLNRVTELASCPDWVMDGNYPGTLEIRLPRADAIIFLDLPRWRCMASLVWRTLKHVGRTRPSMAPGCPERFSLEFLKHAWQCRAAIRPLTLAGIGRLRADQRGIILRSRSEVRAFAAALPAFLTTGGV